MILIVYFQLFLGYEPKGEDFVEEPEEDERIDFFARNSMIMVLRNPQNGNKKHLKCILFFLKICEKIKSFLDEATQNYVQKGKFILMIMTALAIVSALINIIRKTWKIIRSKKKTKFSYLNFYLQ